MKWVNKSKHPLEVGNIIYVKKLDNGYYELKQLPKINGSIVVMDPYTGRVLAMSGVLVFYKVSLIELLKP